MTAADPGVDRSTTISVSEGLATLLARLQTSIAFTSYQTGQLFMVGVGSGGRIRVDQQRHERAMGVTWDGRRLHLATATQIIRFENMLEAGEIADGRNDAVLVPRVSWTTNDVDAHELATDGDGRPLFVATRYNCIATVDERYSFANVWMPPFIAGSDNGDRCHLNGMAMSDGRLACVSLVGKSDIKDGWREHRREGGAILECRTGRTLVDGLSMPHSPRIRDGSLWFLEAGTGQLQCVTLATGERRSVAFLPGFARGLAFSDGYAVVTVSKPRDARFDGLALGDELRRRRLEAWCGLLLVNLATGGIDGWLRLTGFVEELFDATVLPGIRCPRSLAAGTRELWENVRPRPL